MLAEPEVGRLVHGYEDSSGRKNATNSTKHHEQNSRTQKFFVDKVEAPSRVQNEMGNPFQLESGNLLVLDTKRMSLIKFLLRWLLLITREEGNSSSHS